MQTFLPFADFKDSALVLDRARLGKQRLEAKQIIMTLEGTTPHRGWQHHPAVLMWRGHTEVLALYGLVVCMEWRRRGYVDNMLSFFALRVPKQDFAVPWWLGYEPFHLSHQSNLVRKQPEHYQRFFPDVSADLPYFWPTSEPQVASEEPMDELTVQSDIREQIERIFQ